MIIETAGDNPLEFSYEIHNYPEIIKYANHILTPMGSLKFEKASNYCYLKIPDEYIYDTFSLLENKYPERTFYLPEYFCEKNNTGAHISLVYPDENNAALIRSYIESKLDTHMIDFSVNDLISIAAFDKILYALTITCPELEEIRKKFDLLNKLNYHGLLVPFHITIARGEICESI